MATKTKDSTESRFSKLVIELCNMGMCAACFTRDIAGDDKDLLPLCSALDGAMEEVREP